MAWKPNDIAPLSLGDEFAAPATEWTGEYWGPATLAFNAAQAGGASYNGHVDFVAVGAASFAAHLKEEAALAEGGIGTETVQAHTLLRAQVAFAGVAAMTATAHLKEGASLADAGVGAFTGAGQTLLRAAIAFVANSVFGVTARMLLRAASSEAGVGALTVDGHVVSGASTLNGHVDFAATAALAVAQPTELLATQVSFASSASLAIAAPSQILNAQISFGGGADLQAGAPPEVLQPTLGGGGGRPSYVKRQPRPLRLRTSVGFRGEAIFAARAHVVPAALPSLEVVWPRFTEPTPVEIPFQPAAAAHLDVWTEEEELVALLTFAEMAA